MPHITKFIAFYLPQFHPIPENDAAWGKGFTEWFNVTKARPLYKGHHQPRRPADLGFYDLRLKETMADQISLAKQNGVDGFCFYTYWFNGKRVLNKPVDTFLADPSLDMPFMLCWPNEPWNKHWDGSEHEVFLDIQHTPEDDVTFIEAMIPAFRDKRYIKIDGKPVFMIYRHKKFPDFAATAQRWREAVKKAGFPDLYLVCTLTIATDKDLSPVGSYDRAIRFSPGIVPHSLPYCTYKTHRMIEYRSFYNAVFSEPHAKNCWQTVFPSWDNTARRKKRGWIFYNTSPEAYSQVLSEATRMAQSLPEAERFVFINAWNEWAEGAYLEPDQKYGQRYLQMTRHIHEGGQPLSQAPQDRLPPYVCLSMFAMRFYKTYLKFNWKTFRKKYGMTRSAA